MPTKATCSLAAAALLAGCMGQTPVLAPASLSTDAGATCPELTNELARDHQRIGQLNKEYDQKIWYNAAIVTGGLFLWPIWFAADAHSDQKAEIRALDARDNTILALQRDRCPVALGAGGQ